MSAASIQNRAVTAIVAALAATGAPAPVYRARFEEFVGEQLPAYNVFPSKRRHDYGNSAVDESVVTCEVTVRCMAQAISGVDQAVDALEVWAHQQIMTDPNLAGLVADCRITAAEYEYVQKAGNDQVAVDLTVDVEFSALRSDPTVNRTYYGN